ncbi:hypothetical protein [Streptomyces sp. NPDC014894]|uniref:hypothetical protein n=1 Tax=Streptomyces sp. NPDC014894 TaxID=3364931 RepID=UPI0036FF1EB9
MSLVRAEADLIRLCGTAGLNDGQQALLRALLTACDPDAVLTRHAASAPTAIAALAKARTALASRSLKGRKELQPYPKLALEAQRDAHAVLASVRGTLPRGAVDGAVRLLGSIVAGGRPGLTDADDCAGLAARLGREVSAVHTAVTDAFAAAWDGSPDAETRDRLALEAATLCLLRGRHHDRLQEDVRAALSRGPLDGARLTGVLLPAEREFRVAVVVEGAARLTSLAGLMDPAARPVVLSVDDLAGGPNGGPADGWGRGSAQLRQLAAYARDAAALHHAWSGDRSHSHALLALRVRAVDLGAAALRGRRDVLELLDQYVAGQRISGIRLRPETLAHDERTGRSLRLSVPAMGSGVVQPLNTHWPRALRESLRTAHIARATEAPLAAAGLCWAALEALEVKEREGGPLLLARALSLQALRQQIVALHQELHTAVPAAVTAARTALRAARGRAAALDRAVGKTASAASPDPGRAKPGVAASSDRAVRGAGGAAPELAAKAAAAHAAVREHEAALARALRARDSRAVLDAWTGAGENGRLEDLDRWLDALAPRAGAEPALREAADALAAVADLTGGSVAAGVDLWRARLADPARCARWLTGAEKRFAAALGWLYVLRNTALHDGRFISDTDQLDVHAGRALVDLTLEFLGNWYRHAVVHAPDRAGWSAVAVIEHLADRQLSLVAELGNGSREPWNVTRMTSPTSTGWDRVRGTAAGPDGG